MLPDPASHGLVATVRPGGRAPLTSAEAELLAAIPHRHTHRGPFVPGEVAARLLAEMPADAAAEGCQLLLIDDRATIVGLGKLVERAAAQQCADAEISAELQPWVRAGQALHRLLLHAATRWVFASLLSQPLESPRYRRAVCKLTGLAGDPHMLLQFGRANRAAATPRRPVGEIWTDEGL